MLDDDAGKTRYLFSNDMIKFTGSFVEALYKKRRGIIYKT